jgi:dolichol-phosphate mannosyltransferase
VGIKKQSVSIIVPTLNEAVNLPRLLKRIDKSLSKATLRYEVIVIDDNSNDDTAQVAKDLAKTYNLRFLTKVGPRGKAYSLLEGFSHAKYDLVCMIDADLQYPPEAIAPMINKLITDNTDIVLSERIDRQVSLTRRLFSKIFNFVFVKLLFGIEYDSQSGLKLFKKQVLTNMVIAPSPWSFDLEFIVRSIESGYKISNYEIPFSKRDHGDAKINLVTTAIELSLASIRLRRTTSLHLLHQGTYKRSSSFRLTRTFKLFVSLLAALALCLAPLKVSALSITANPTSILQPIIINPQTTTSQPEATATPNPKASTTNATSTKASTADVSSLATSSNLKTGNSSVPTIFISDETGTKKAYNNSANLTGANSSSSNKAYYNDSSSKKGNLKKLERIALIALFVGFGLLIIALLVSIFLIKKKPLKEYRMFGYKASS